MTTSLREHGKLYVGLVKTTKFVKGRLSGSNYLRKVKLALGSRTAGEQRASLQPGRPSTDSRQH